MSRQEQFCCFYLFEAFVCLFIGLFVCLVVHGLPGMCSPCMQVEEGPRWWCCHRTEVAAPDDYIFRTPWKISFDFLVFLSGSEFASPAQYSFKCISPSDVSAGRIFSCTNLHKTGCDCALQTVCLAILFVYLFVWYLIICLWQKTTCRWRSCEETATWPGSASKLLPVPPSASSAFYSIDCSRGCSHEQVDTCWVWRQAGWPHGGNSTPFEVKSRLPDQIFALTECLLCDNVHLARCSPSVQDLLNSMRKFHPEAVDECTTLIFQVKQSFKYSIKRFDGTFCERARAR